MNKQNTFFATLLMLFGLSTPCEAESLDNFLGKVRGQNLDLASQDKLIHAAHESSKGINLKPPSIGVSQMRNLVGVSYAFEVQQEVPLSSRLGSDKKSREGKFELQKKVSLYDSHEILLQARLAFVNYWMNYEKLKLIDELSGWLKHHAQYAQSQVRSSTDIKIYALEIEGTIGVIENEASNLKDGLEVEKARLKSLVYDNAYEPGTPVLGVEKDFFEATEASKMASINLSMLKIADSDLEVAKSSSMPNLFVKVRKLDRPMIGMANQEIMLGIDLPFAFFWQPRAEKAQAHANKFVAEAKYKKSQVESASMKETLKRRAVIVKNQISTLEKVSLPAAEKRLKYLKNISPRDMNGLESHHKIFHDYIDLKTQLIETRYKYEELYANWTLLFTEGKLDDI